MCTCLLFFFCCDVRKHPRKFIANVSFTSCIQTPSQEKWRGVWIKSFFIASIACLPNPKSKSIKIANNSSWQWSRDTCYVFPLFDIFLVFGQTFCQWCNHKRMQYLNEWMNELSSTDLVVEIYIYIDDKIVCQNMNTWSEGDMWCKQASANCAQSSSMEHFENVFLDNRLVAFLCLSQAPEY